MLLPRKPNQQQMGPGSGSTAEDLAHWVAVLPGSEAVCFLAANRSWPVEAEWGSAHAEGPVSGRALIAPMDSATEMAKAYRTRLHTVWEVAPVWWVLAMLSFWEKVMEMGSRSASLYLVRSDLEASRRIP